MQIYHGMKMINNDSCAKCMFKCQWIHIKTCLNMEQYMDPNNMMDPHKLSVQHNGSKSNTVTQLGVNIPKPKLGLRTLGRSKIYSQNQIL